MLLVKTLLLFTAFLAAFTCTTSAASYWKHNENQGQVHACHSFSLIALIEAEYYRKTGKRINLSERDLFIRHYSKGNPRQLVQQHLQAAASKRLPEHYAETGHISENFKILTRYGVASEKELPFGSFFGGSVESSVRALRSQRTRITREALQLKSQGRWSRKTAQFLITKHSQKLSKVRQYCNLPATTPTRTWTKNWISSYRLVKKSSQGIGHTKSSLIQQLRYRPVAVDIHNFHELQRSKALTISRHSLVVSQYHPRTDEFSIRCSSATHIDRVPANTLSKGVYQYYYLSPKSSSNILSYTWLKLFQW